MIILRVNRLYRKKIYFFHNKFKTLGQYLSLRKLTLFNIIL